jgi:hypothetical protein
MSIQDIKFACSNLETGLGIYEFFGESDIRLFLATTKHFLHIYNHMSFVLNIFHFVQSTFLDMHHFLVI